LQHNLHRSGLRYNNNPGIFIPGFILCGKLNILKKVDHEKNKYYNEEYKAEPVKFHCKASLQVDKKICA
jgi:hypothetical protein